MTCPKCQQENPDAAQFCRRCHMTLRFTCPACKHVQMRGGTCDQCGVDFLKYAMMMHSQMENEAQAQRDRMKDRNAALRQVFLLPLTGGYSLIRYLKARARGE